MPTLILKFKENELNNYRLEKGKSLTIGRLESNDIIIENLAVSGMHAKVDSLGDSFLLTDLKSKNGSFVNQQMITAHYLKGGDVITIGKHSLVFGYDENETPPDNDAVADDDMNQTMIMDTVQHKAMLAKAEEKKQTETSVLSFLTGGEGEVELSRKLMKIGKDPSCDVVVGGFMVGKTSATISKRPNGYYLSYVAGMSKPKVNDKVVKESVELKDFDIIEIGTGKMQFVQKG